MLMNCEIDNVSSLLGKIKFENAMISEFALSIPTQTLSLKVEKAEWIGLNQLTLPAITLELSDWKRMEWQRLTLADDEYGAPVEQDLYEVLKKVSIRYGQHNIVCIKGQGALSNIWFDIKFERIKKIELLFDQDDASNLCLAAIEGSLSRIEELLNQGVDPSIPKFYWNGHYIETVYSIIKACEKGNLQIVRFLVEKGADVNVRTQGDGQTPLHTAFFIDSTLPQKLSDAERESQIREMIQYLVEQGANVNAKGGFCLAPLHQAVSHGNTEIVKYLIQYGADVNLFLEDVDENESRATALGCAVQENNLEIAKLLIKHGANPLVGNEISITPMEEALELKNEEILQLLKEL